MHNAWLMLLMSITSPGVWGLESPGYSQRERQAVSPLESRKAVLLPALPLGLPEPDRPECLQLSLLKVMGFVPLNWIKV